MSNRYSKLVLCLWATTLSLPSTMVRADQPRTPADQFAHFTEEHTGTEDFVRALGDKFRERFRSAGDASALLGLCQQLGSAGTFGLPHPSLQELGLACQSTDESRIRQELLKFSQDSRVNEFIESARAHLKQRGSVKAFAKDLSTTLKGTERPLLAFGIFVLFAT